MKYETIKFNSPDGTPLTGLFFPAEGEVLGTVVHFHGNAQNMTAHYPCSAWLAAEGYNVFIFDYRGYGASGGKATLEGLVKDGAAALDHALKLPGASPDKIIVLGQSLGGAVAVAALAGSKTVKPAALILEGTFYSYKGVASEVFRRRWYSWPLMWLPYLAVSGKYAPSDGISGLTGPKLFIHSKKDRVVPFSQGLKLYEAAPEPKEFWETPDGHIETFCAFREIYGPGLLEYLRKNIKK